VILEHVGNYGGGCNVNAAAGSVGHGWRQGAAMLLWFVVSAAVLGALVFWVVFPGTSGLRYCFLCWGLVCFLSTGKPGTGRPERCETAGLSLAPASGWDRYN
jgi:hypothetical protein